MQALVADTLIRGLLKRSARYRLRWLWGGGGGGVRDDNDDGARGDAAGGDAAAGGGAAAAAVAASLSDWPRRRLYH